MVDFKVRVGKKDAPKELDPTLIYEKLDRAVDKGPLRPAQVSILGEWHTKRRIERDVIIKLHTGQGKTLIGLLALQSKLNEGVSPSLYLCPNNFLVAQTCTQAKKFGFRYCTAEQEIPVDFLEGRSILITSIQKLFNGLSKFGLNNASKRVGAIVLDDAHSCIESIQSSCMIKIPRDDAPYTSIKELFAQELQQQGMGTFADLCGGSPDAAMLVPYWAWKERQEEVTSILAKNKDKASIKFSWPILKDQLSHCQCFVSGTSLEIIPNLAPLHVFGSFFSAAHRVFMSATVSDDSFLIKGLGLRAETILNPLVYSKETWSGEKMVLIPSLINDTLDRSAIVKRFGEPNAKRAFGVVALTPSFARTQDWEAYKAIVPKPGSIEAIIDGLRQGEYEKTVVFANRYDGIDLPDDTCRLLILDSLPYAENVIDKYTEGVRATGQSMIARVARAIEQGLGRSVRGEKDYSTIVMTGPDLVRFVRASANRTFLSCQTRTQIEIGVEIADMASEEIAKGKDPMMALEDLTFQCIKRDEGWKQFYKEKMDEHAADGVKSIALEVFRLEFDAEKLFEDGKIDEAVVCIQSLIDKHISDSGDVGWYMQEMARYLFVRSKKESNDMQIQAHRKNRHLLRPRTGMTIERMTLVGQKRVQNVINWIKSFSDYSEMMICLEEMLANVSFGVKADKFEGSLKDLGSALGFASQRPDKEWKEGPDNLWGLRDQEYLVVECKSEVEMGRAEVNKHETEQMNRSCAWFEKHYPGCRSRNFLIIPTHRIASAAALTHEIKVVKDGDLNKLKRSVRSFLGAFSGLDFHDLSEGSVQQLLDTHGLSIDTLMNEYGKDIYNKKS